VLLPLPLVPSNATVSPSYTSMDTWCNTRTAPYPASTSVSTSLFAKVGFLHRGVMHNLLRCALGDGAAGIEDNNTVGKTHHSSHNMFDHDNAQTTFVERGENSQDLVDLGAGEPGHGFIGNQQPRPGRHSAGQFELTQLDQGKMGRAHVGLGLKANELEDGH